MLLLFFYQKSMTCTIKLHVCFTKNKKAYIKFFVCEIHTFVYSVRIVVLNLQ